MRNRGSHWSPTRTEPLPQSPSLRIWSPSLSDGKRSLRRLSLISISFSYRIRSWRRHWGSFRMMGRMWVRERFWGRGRGFWRRHFGRILRSLTRWIGRGLSYQIGQWGLRIFRREADEVCIVQKEDVKYVWVCCQVLLQQDRDLLCCWFVNDELDGFESRRTESFPYFFFLDISVLRSSVLKISSESSSSGSIILLKLFSPCLLSFNDLQKWSWLDEELRISNQKVLTQKVDQTIARMLYPRLYCSSHWSRYTWCYSVEQM